MRFGESIVKIEGKGLSWMRFGNSKSKAKQKLKKPSIDDKTRVCHFERQKWSPDRLHFYCKYAIYPVFIRLTEF